MYVFIFYKCKLYVYYFYFYTMITNDTYYADRSHLTTSGMKHLLHSYKSFLHAMAHNSDKAVFIQGRALHSAVLTPYLNEVSTDDNHAGHRYKLPYKVYEAHIGMVNALRSDATVMELLSGARTEQIYTALLEGVKMKCMVDADRDNIIVDIKTCEDATPQAFKRSAKLFHYDLQAANYIDITGKGAFIFVAVEKKAPHNIAIYQASSEMIASGRAKRAIAIQTLKDKDKPTLIQQIEW